MGSAFSSQKSSAAPKAVSNPLPPRQDQFPFMQLSAEIRLIIYRMALLYDGPLLFSIQKKVEKPADDFDDWEPSFDSGNILRHLIRNDSGVVVGPRNQEHVALDFSSDEDDDMFFGGPSPAGRPRTRTTRFGSTNKRNRRPASNEAKPKDPSESTLVPAILRVSKQIHREARPVLYSENRIVLDLNTAIHSLTSLRQPTRNLFKHIRISLTSHHDILDGFSDLVRVALRYCWGLQTLTISLPGGWSSIDSGAGADAAEKNKYSKNNVYANAFLILRWLPKSTKVILEGEPSPEIRRVVEHCGRLAKELDEAAYQKRQLRLEENA